MITPDLNRIVPNPTDYTIPVVECVDGEWRDGHWIEFEPVALPQKFDFEARPQ